MKVAIDEELEGREVENIPSRARDSPFFNDAERKVHTENFYI